VNQGWQRLKYLVEVNARDLDEKVDPGFEFRYLDIGSVGRGALFEEPERMTFAAAPARARRLVQPGDTISQPEIGFHVASVHSMLVSVAMTCATRLQPA